MRNNHPLIHLFIARARRALTAGVLALGALLILSHGPQSLAQGPELALSVMKSPTCGCCQAWVDQLQAQGFKVSVSHPDDLPARKAALGLAPQVQSCHTATTEAGYVFEGHVPGALIRRFLAEKPSNARGLAVPQMPIGSPGMEMGKSFEPYDVLLLKQDGSTQVYAHVPSAQAQAALGGETHHGH